jgi:hypothetical protein
MIAQQQVRRMTPKAQSIAVGDAVAWNGCYAGRVEAVNGETAVVLEEDNRMFGRPTRWRLRLDALARIGDREC